MARRPPRGALLASIALSLGFCVFVAATAWWILAPQRGRQDRASDWIALAATVAEDVPVREVGDSVAATVWQLGGGLETAPVYAIAPAAAGALRAHR